MYLFREGSRHDAAPHFERVATPDEANAAEKPLLFFPEAKTAMWMFETGMPEKALIHWVRDVLVKSDRAFVDIGAHVGTYSLVCARKAAVTHAFECSPKTFCYLAANIALHGLTDRVRPYSCALGAAEGVLPYFVRSEDGGGNGVQPLGAVVDAVATTVPVTVRTLDSFGLENIGCVKIDVEGFEKNVLVGAQDTLRRSDYPPIVFESWGAWKDASGTPASEIRAELFAYIRSLGYDIEPLRGATDMFLATHARSLP